MEYAKDELDLSVDYLQYNRLGVWTRCMNSPEIKDYIGLDNPKEYDELIQQLGFIDDSRLQEVIRDLSKRSDGRGAIVNDSRLVTSYGRVLNNEKARQALREHENLPLAVQILSNQGYADRISIVANQVLILVDELSSEDIDIETATEASRPARKLFGSARTLNATLSDIVKHEDRF